MNALYSIESTVDELGRPTALRFIVKMSHTLARHFDGSHRWYLFSEDVRKAAEAAGIDYILRLTRDDTYLMVYLKPEVWGTPDDPSRAAAAAWSGWIMKLLPVAAIVGSVADEWTDALLKVGA